MTSYQLHPKFSRKRWYIYFFKFAIVETILSGRTSRHPMLMTYSVTCKMKVMTSFRFYGNSDLVKRTSLNTFTFSSYIHTYFIVASPMGLFRNNYLNNLLLKLLITIQLKLIKFKKHIQHCLKLQSIKILKINEFKKYLQNCLKAYSLSYV